MHMSVCECTYACVQFSCEQETAHASTNMKIYVVLELSERKELAFKTGCRTCFSVRPKFPIYSACLWCAVL